LPRVELLIRIKAVDYYTTYNVFTVFSEELGFRKY
jgi:hypothetical protein